MYLAFDQQILSFLYRLRAHLKSVSKKRKGDKGGFTLLELMVVVGILGTITSTAIPAYSNYIKKVRITKAMVEIRIFEKEIKAFEAENQSLPNTLNDIGRGTFQDPWGNPYQYLNISLPGANTLWRRDRNNNPVNTDFDLYSIGGDGRTQKQFTARFGRDDIVRANDGEYVGLARDY
jgi:general secretion pathway protein G